jgi:hypothetical protein
VRRLQGDARRRRDTLVKQQENGVPRRFVTLEIGMKDGPDAADPWGNEPIYLDQSEKRPRLQLQAFTLSFLKGLLEVVFTRIIAIDAGGQFKGTRGHRRFASTARGRHIRWRRPFSLVGITQLDRAPPKAC